jgi:hypothetical protein
MHEVQNLTTCYPLTAKRWSVGILILAAASLLGCGDVKGTDNQGSDAAVNPCAPNPCLLSDDFGGAALDPAIWGVSVGGGATVVQHNGVLTLHVPAAADAFVDVYSLVGFPVGTTFEANVTFSAGQLYDHKGAGFASTRIDRDCGAGETDAAMFRGQDGDGNVETKVAGGAPVCTLTAHNYPAGPNMLQISRAADQVLFNQNNVMLPPVKTSIPAGLLPVRFSAYTFTMAPKQPVQIDVDYVRVSRL